MEPIVDNMGTCGGCRTTGLRTVKTKIFMKVKYLKFRRWLLLALLGTLGVASCSKSTDDDIQLMYGVPETEYNDNR